MAILIAVFILIGSILGMVVILFRRIQIISELPETIPGPGLKTRVLNIKAKIQNSKLSEHPSFEIVLQKILSKVRILSLRIEKKTSSWLQRLREKSIRKKENDKYWEDLKDSIDRENESNETNLPG